MRDQRDLELDKLLSPLRDQAPTPDELQRWKNSALLEAQRNGPKSVSFLKMRGLAQVAAGVAAGLFLGYLLGSQRAVHGDDFEISATIVQVQAKSD